jgi:DNA processing protein
MVLTLTTTIKDDRMAISPGCEKISQLSSIKGLGLKTFYRLYSHFGSVERIVSADFQMLRELGLAPVKARAIVDLQEAREAKHSQPAIDKLNAWDTEGDQYVLCIEDSCYPSMLREIFCPPPLIYAKGDLSSLSLAAIAVVGSRKPSIAGQQHAFEFSRDLSYNGFNIISGLALGVDTQAHRGALSASGITCAVLGTGLDVIYPKQNAKLAAQICEQGILISELALGSLPVPANFPRRNRLVSGLSKGSLIVEAGLKSGSLITANYALEQNREVYVIPGPIDSLVAAGCNALIKQGAQLVTCIEDILGDPFNKLSGGNELGHDVPSEDACIAPEKSALAGLTASETKIITLVGFQCTSFDLLISSGDLAPGELSQTLISLELKGLICSVPGGYQRVKSVNSQL